MWVILNNKEKLLFDNFAEAKSKFNSLISSHMKDNPDVYFNGMPVPLGSYFNYLFECNQPIDDVYDYTNNILLCLSEGVALNNIIDLKYYDDHEFGKVYIESNKNYFVASVDDEFISLSYSVNNDPYATYRFTSKQRVCSSKNISDIGKMVCKGIILYYDSGVRFDKRSLDDFNEHSQIITINSTNHDLEWYKNYSNRIVRDLNTDFMKTMHRQNDTIDTFSDYGMNMIYEYLIKYLK